MKIRLSFIQSQKLSHDSPRPVMTTKRNLNISNWANSLWCTLRFVSFPIAKKNYKFYDDTILKTNSIRKVIKTDIKSREMQITMHNDSWLFSRHAIIVVFIHASVFLTFSLRWWWWWWWWTLVMSMFIIWSVALRYYSEQRDHHKVFCVMSVCKEIVL